MHHNAGFNITPRDSCESFCVDSVTWIFPLLPMSVLSRRICTAYFPLCFSLLLTFSLFPLFNRLLSPLDSVIAILKHPLPSPAFCLCLSQFLSLLISTQQRCFLGEHLLFSLVFSLPPAPSHSFSQLQCFLHDT